MKNLKMLYIALIALVAGAFGACTNEFEPGPQMSGPQVSFLSSNPTSLEFTGDAAENAQKLTLSRIEKDEELEVLLLIEVEKGAEKLFTIPETVTFATGEATTELNFTVNQELFENDKEYKVNFVIADEMQSTPYGYTEWTVKFALNPWELMTDSKGNNAKGKFRGADAIANVYSSIDPTVEVDVNIYEHKSQKGLYKVENPWHLTVVAGFGFPDLETAAANGITFTNKDFIIDCSNPEAVTFELQDIGCDFGYGLVYVMAAYWYDQEYAGGENGFAPGTLSEGIITFPTNGTLAMEPGYDSSIYYGNSNGLFRIVLPGYEATDYSLAVAYDGMDVAADNKTTTAKFKFSYGADVTGINYMLVEGDIENDPSDALTTLFAGEDEKILSVENFVKGEGEVGVKVGLERGMYTLVAASMDKDGNLDSKSAIAYYFYFPGLGDMEDHSCEIDVLVRKMSECVDIFGPDYVAANPDYSAFGYCIVGKDIKSVKFLITETATVEYYEANGYTLEQLTEEYGTEITAEYLAYVNSEGGLANFQYGLDGNTSYTIAVVAVNKYSEKATVAKTHTTDAIPYNGSLVLGDYSMSCVMWGGTEDEFPSENIFNIVNIAGYDNQFLLSEFAIEDSLKWYATYDETANTLTLSGLTVGNEDRGSLFGRCYGYYSQDGKYMYGIAYYATPSSNGTDSVVLKVDPETNQICGLPTGAELWVTVYDVTSGQPEPVGAHNIFDDTTVIAPYVPAAEGEQGGASTASVKSVSTPSVQTLMRNVSKVNMLKIATRNVQLANFANIATSANISKKAISAVKPSVVENYTPVKAQGFQKVKTNAGVFRR